MRRALAFVRSAPLASAATILGTVALAQAITLFYSGGHQTLTYVVWWVVTIAFFAVAVIDFVRRRPAPLTPPVIRYRLNGADDLSARLRPDKPQTVILEIEFENPNKTTIREANLNVLMTEHIRAGHAVCDQYGDLVPRGHWLLPKQHRIDGELAPGSHKDRWASEGEVFSPGAKLLCFKLHLSEPGIYYFALRLWGERLPALPDVETCMRVEQGPPPEPRDQMSEVIYKGEQLGLYKADAYTGLEPPHEWVVWVADATLAVPEDYIDRFNKAKPEGGGWKDDLRACLRALYEIRSLSVDQP